MSVYDEVKAERRRQDEKWGVKNHHPMEWISILGEEYGKVSKGAVKAHFCGYESTADWSQYREKLINVAAVAVAMVECYDQNGPPEKV